MGILIWVHMTHHVQKAKCMQYGTASYQRTIILHISEPFDMHWNFTCMLSIHSVLLGLLPIIRMSVQMQASLFAKQKLLSAAKEMLPLSTFSCGIYPFLLFYTSWSEATSKSCLEQEVNQSLERSLFHC